LRWLLSFRILDSSSFPATVNIAVPSTHTFSHTSGAFIPSTTVHVTMDITNMVASAYPLMFHPPPVAIHVPATRMVECTVRATGTSTTVSVRGVTSNLLDDV
jgi:hypothetical protein